MSTEELEALEEALERRRPLEYEDPEEAWERFLRDNAEELEAIWGPGAETVQPDGPALADADPGAPRRRPRRNRVLLRAGLAAAVLLVVLAGSALAANGLGYDLWAWVRGFSDAPASVQEAEGSPIQKALVDLGIQLPLYPTYLPKDYVLAEAHISPDPLLLYEMYTRGDRYISITITSVSAMETEGQPREDRLPEEYQVGGTVHYLFSNSGSITAIWRTGDYVVSVSGNITIRVIKNIINSVYSE